MRLAACVLAIVFLLDLAPAGQSPRDVRPAAPTGAATGAIRGRVVAADSGVPIRRALVTITARGFAQTVYTDARGRYEVRVPPGMYVVQAAPNQHQGQFLRATIPILPSGEADRIAVVEGQISEAYELRLPRAGAIVGRLVDESGDPVSGVGVRAIHPGDRSELGNYGGQSSDEFGRYRIYGLPPGTYQIMAKAFGGGDDAFAQGQSLGFIDTYYPGTYSRDEAGSVRVRAGEETAAGDLVLTRTRMIRVKGTVLDSQGVPASARTMIALSGHDMTHSAGIGAEGRFSFQPRPPGTYRLIARMLDDSRENTLEYASVPLTLVDADVEDAVVSMKPTVSLTGRVVFEGGVSPVLAADALTIGTEVKDRSIETQLVLRPSAVAPDLTFTLRRLAGELLVRPNGRAMSDLSLKTVLLGNQDITDLPTEFRAEDSNRLQIVLTTRASELTGGVTNDKGGPVRCMVVLFGEDKATWFRSSVRFRMTWTERDGRFSLKGLKAGRYYVIAVPPERSVNSQTTLEAAAFEALTKDATALVLGEDEQRVIDLKIAMNVGGGDD